MLTGVNIEATVELARELSVPVIASGGITDLDDMKALCKVERKASSARSPAARSIRARSISPSAQKLADEPRDGSPA